MIKKGELFLLILVIIIVMGISVFAAPPNPPNITIVPPSYCSPQPEICDGLADEDCDGVVDNGCTCSSGQTQPCGNDTGACQAGTQTCVLGVWALCIGSIGPVTEVCGDGLDNDCDNVVDNGCTCTSGQTQTCGTDVGSCNVGTQTCVNGTWGMECVGSVSPVTEICNDGFDNDCDGSTDEGCSTDISGGTTPRTTNPGTTTPTTTTPNTTTTTSGSNPSTNQNIIPAITEIIQNTTLLEAPNVTEKVNNLSQSDIAKGAETIFGFEPLKAAVIGAILICIIIFLSIFILDYSKKQQRDRDAKLMRSITQQNQGVVIDVNARRNLSSQELQVMNYIDAMRKRGYKDDYIHGQLQTKGWREEVLAKLLKI
jgi:hypothetical protein